jgi:hypothetical protein
MSKESAPWCYLFYYRLTQILLQKERSNKTSLGLITIIIIIIIIVIIITITCTPHQT